MRSRLLRLLKGGTYCQLVQYRRSFRNLPTMLSQLSSPPTLTQPSTPCAISRQEQITLGTSELLKSETPKHSVEDINECHSYEEAVKALNSLQSNAAMIQANKQKGRKQSDNISVMLNLLDHLDIQPDDLDKLNIIHIAGTKGKGSTSAFCESILRHHGYSTGFYSSPHLVEVRERIRLNGKAIDKKLFTKYFWLVYTTLKSKLTDSEPMPAYFRFLTLLAFKVFISEGVDAVIMEVGIGGRFDSTNVFNKPLVCGITSLGIDHTDILGNTLEEITWNKAGILKPACPAVTIRQPDNSLAVLHQCAEEVGAGLYEAPRFNVRNKAIDTIPSLNMNGDIQLLNASLAVQLCRIFIDRLADRDKWTSATNGGCLLPLVNLTDPYISGLSNCQWPGRFHKVKRTNVTYYMDGAHTVDSISQAFNWFRRDSEKEAENELKGRQICKVLMFNKTGIRTPQELLQPLVSDRFKFDYAVFCPNIIMEIDDKYFATADLHMDCSDKRVLPSNQLMTVLENRDTWISLNSLRDAQANGVRNGCTQIPASENKPTLDTTLSSSIAFPCVNAAVDWLARGCDPEISMFQFQRVPYLPSDIHLQVFVTGSLYLVGNSFIALKEQIN